MGMQISQGREDLLSVYTQDLLVAGAERFILRLQAVRHHLHEEGGFHFLFVQHAAEVLYNVRVTQVFK